MESLGILLCIAFFTISPLIANAGDPDILTDFVVYKNLSSTIIHGNFFTYAGTCFLTDDDTSQPNSFTILKKPLPLNSLR